MLRSAECTINIEPPREREFFTSSDLVKGKICIDVRRDLHVASIEAQMRCDDRGRVFASETSFPAAPDLSAAHFDAAKTLWESDSISFDIPSDGVLPKGLHEYSFEFVLPADTDRLPCSYSVEANHTFNGIFWGVHATIDRESRTRPNYYNTGYVQVYPKRSRQFSGNQESFAHATHVTHVRMSRRPSFLARSDLQKAEVAVEGRLAFPSEGISQSRKPVAKEGAHIPEIRVAVKCDREGLVVVREIVLLLDTKVCTLVNDKQNTTQDTAIVISRECNEEISRKDDWIDLTHIVGDARVFGVPETCMTDIHDIQHTLRVQLTLSPAHKPTRTTFLEVSAPVLVLSEATVNTKVQPPPPYHNDEAV